MSQTATSAGRRVGISELEQRVQMHRTTIWRHCRAGRFPAPHYLGERRFWFETEIAAWEHEQMARPASARRAAQNLAGGRSTPELAS